MTRSHPSSAWTEIHDQWETLRRYGYTPTRIKLAPEALPEIALMSGVIGGQPRDAAQFVAEMFPGVTVETGWIGLAHDGTRVRVQVCSDWTEPGPIPSATGGSVRMSWNPDARLV